MRVLGISALSHDASISVVEDGEILFAAHSERYSRVKNDAFLNQAIVDEALSFGAPDVIAWYERPLVKKTRQAYAGQWQNVWDRNAMPRRHLAKFGLEAFPLEYVSHHESHAYAGVLTSRFDDAIVIIMDAIGEWSTFSIGEFKGGELKWIREQVYPHSLGLLYTAFTKRCGCKPNEEEYIVMGMSAFGEPKFTDDIINDFIDYDANDFRFALKANLHRGIGNWRPEAQPLDIAASVQAVTERIVLDAVKWAGRTIASKNLVLMGGVALNCVANSHVANYWASHSGSKDRIWIMPNPGDAGSSLGAAGAVLGQPLSWNHPYLGTEIARPFELDRMLKRILDKQVIAVANGRAEFGPRALGNRSIIADPRGQDMKDRVNAVKRREMFRPFAPVVLEEHADRYFETVTAASPYMQFTVRCKEPKELAAVIHVDGTSRVQTVTKAQNPNLHALIEAFYAETGCPVLLNTSMNIKGEPLVNDWEDALRFQTVTGVEVF